MDRDAIARIAVEYCWSMKEKEDSFEEAAAKTIEFVKSSLPGGSEIDINWLKEHLRLSITQEVSDYLMLQGEDQNTKDKWWSDQKDENLLGHWSRWTRYLSKVKKWSPAVIDSIDKTTDKILDAVDDPKRSTHISDRRGLVLGYVQSGKTAHYTGLINKALDAGFQLIIVLAGMHDSLRIQTQTRLDEEVLGFETSIDVLLKNGMVGKLIGVGELSYPPELKLRTYTTRDPKGDFNKVRANKIEDLEGRPSVFIVKKNATVLKNLYQFFRTGNLTKDHLLKQGKAIIANIPMLIIDDEADQASVNTKAISDENGNILPEYKPSRINAEIRRIYNLFCNKAYVGYTATPYANIFIHDEAGTEEYGRELFPKDFILCLPKPSNYIGPAEFFGLNRDDGEAMNLIREVSYDPLFVPAKAKKGHIPERLPETLVDAIGAFLIASSVRVWRKQENEHMSMLIHAARFTDIHCEIKDLVVRKINDIKNRLRYEDVSEPSSFAARLKVLWEDDFVATTNHTCKYFSDLAGECKLPEWSFVMESILLVIEKLEVLEVNGVSDDELKYKDYNEGRIVIAVGGDKLSRGLTLEGLSTSYFLRASTLYDTLMQMGRWFGYRLGYLDVCRLYTTPTLAEWFGHIAVATEELRSELFDMEQLGAMPKEYGLKVRTHSELFIAAKNKMQAAYEMQDDYSNSVSETTKFELNDEDFFRDNQSAVDHFIRQLGTPDHEYLRKKRPSKYTQSASMPKHYFWENVDGFSICSFLSEYKTARNAPRANSTRLREYISKQIGKNGLRDWTVCLINAEESEHYGDKTFDIGGLQIERGVKRARGIRSEKIGAKAFGRLLSQDHEYIDFNDDQMNKVSELRAKATSNKGSRSKIIQDNNGSDWEAATYIRRELRSNQSNHGLLLIYPIEKTDSAFSDLSDEIVPIGIGLVFPPSHESTPVTYMACIEQIPGTMPGLGDRISLYWRDRPGKGILERYRKDMEAVDDLSLLNLMLNIKYDNDETKNIIEATFSKNRNILISKDCLKLRKLNIGDTTSLNFNGKVYEYKIIGSFKSRGDNSEAIIPGAYAKSDFGVVNYGMLAYTAADPDAAMAQIRNLFGNKYNWSRTVMEFEKDFLGVVNAFLEPMKKLTYFILLLAAIGIINNLLINYIQKRHAIAMYKSVGLSNRQNVKMTMIEGFTSGLIGAAAGLFVAYMEIKTIFIVAGPRISVEPKLDAGVFIMTGLAGIIITLIGSVVPILKGFKMKLVEEIKFE